MVVFRRLCETALAVLIPFVATIICKSGFSTHLSVKTKSINPLNAETNMRAKRQVFYNQEHVAINTAFLQVYPKIVSG